MRVPLSWLKDYVEIDIAVEELAHRLTLAGLEVAALEYIGVPAQVYEGGAVPQSTGHLVWDREKIVVGYIVEVKPHPNADRLVLAMVDAGDGEPDQAVTGAPNLFPYIDKGPLDPPLVVAYAREGAELVDAYSDEPNARATLTPRKLRGIENRTMVLSEKELGISDQHERIMLLNTDAAPGTPLQDVLGDVVMDLDLTPNLARAFSMVGVAREVAALTGKTVKMPPVDVQMDGLPIEGQVALDIRDAHLNPRFAVSLIKDITIGPSPEWMQRRLRLAGMRPISNIVDVTNYVMLEVGQPLHAFDYDILVERAGGEPPTIITRTAEPGETLTTLDGVDRELDPFTELVTDTAGALSMAGIMGGEESEINPATKNVVLEAANWNFINVRQTLLAQRERGKEMSSEAGTRFSRGVHPSVAEVGLRRATELMHKLADGEVAEGIIDAYPAPPPEITVDLPLSEVTRILGVALAQSEVGDILEGLQFTVERVGNDALRVTVPDYRMDIGYVGEAHHADIADVIAQADLIEEVARIYGYDKLPNTLIEDALPPQRSNLPLQREERLRDLLARAGLQEIVSYRLTTPAREAMLTPSGSESGWPDADYVTLANPISADKTVMRHTLLAGMLDVAASNARWKERIALFEIGKVYLPVKGKPLPAEPRRLGIVMMGRRELPAWQDAVGAETEPFDYYDLKGIVESLGESLHLPDVRFETVEHNTYWPGRAAALTIAGEPVGTLGELHPMVREAFDLPAQPVLIASVDLDALFAHVPERHTVESVSNYPAIYQDIAVVVDEGTPAADVERLIRQTGGTLLRGVRLFDVYRGDQIGAGKKSLAYGLVFQSGEKTLRDRDADSVRARIVKRLEKEIGAELRA